MSRSTGPSRNRCSITPEDLEGAQQLLRADLAHRLRRPPLLVHRAALAARRGHVDDPLAAADGRRHQPGRAGRCRRPGCAQIAEDRAELCRVVHRAPCRSRRGKACPRRGRPSSVLTRTLTRSPRASRGYASAMIVLIRSRSASGTSRSIHRVATSSFRCLRNSARSRHGEQPRQVVGDARREVGIHLAVEVRLDLEEGLGTVRSTLTHRRILAPWPSPTTPSRALSFPDATDSSRCRSGCP